MSHCPQCGRAMPVEGAAECPFCGAALGVEPPKGPAAPKAAARTMLGVSVKDLPLPTAPAAGAMPSKANRTIVGMPANVIPSTMGPQAARSPGGLAERALDPSAAAQR